MNLILISLLFNCLIKNLIMNKQSCYCKKCKGAVVSKRTFHRHLVKEQHEPYKQNITKGAKKVKSHESFNVYSDQFLPTLPSEPTIVLSDHFVAATTSRKTKGQSIPSIPILRESSITNIPAEIEFEDNCSIISENSINDMDFTDEVAHQDYSDEIVLEYENLNEGYIKNTDYNPINVHYNPPIFNINETKKWVILWTYLFQDTFTLSQTASAALLNFFNELLQSLNENTFSDFPSTIYRADRVLGVELTYKSYIICPRCHQLYLPSILNDKDQHIKCRCNETITKMVRTSKGNYQIKVS